MAVIENSREEIAKTQELESSACGACAFALFRDELFSRLRRERRPFDDEGLDIAETDEGEGMLQIGELKVLGASFRERARSREYELHRAIVE